ncbi:MAG TPA: hypothetical protein VIL28_14090 [Steroidobacteraceae bacterium]
MKMPAALEKLGSRFDALSPRERVLVAVALLVAIAMLWTLSISDPLASRRRALEAERNSLEQNIAALKLGIDSATSAELLAKETQLQKELADVDAKLVATAAGLIPPQRMVQVIYDVLSRQRGVKLISLHNKPAASLVPPTSASTTTETESGSEAVSEAESELVGPFVHPVEIVVEGAYLDVLEYLRALEALEWRFYWKVLELKTVRYPLNRVRIELSTLSMDKEWIGV